MRRSPYTSLREGLVAAWCPSLDLNTNSGVGIIDRSPYKRHLVFDLPISLPNYWQCQDVPALNFSGINTGSDARTSNLSGFPLPGSQVTLACWNYVSAYGDGLGYSYNSACIELATDWQRFILQNYNEPGINNYVFTDAVFGENNLQTTYELPAKQWYHFAITINEFSEYVFYLNGVPHVSGQFPIALEPSGPYHVQIGRREGYDTFYGYLDDIRVYNRVLQPSEVWTLSQVRGAGLEPLPRERRALLSDLQPDTHDGFVRRKSDGRQPFRKPKRVAKRKPEELPPDEPELTPQEVVEALKDDRLEDLSRDLEELSLRTELELLQAARTQVEQQLAAAAADAEQRERERVALARIEELVAQHHKRLEAERAEVADIVALLDSDLWTALEVFDFSARTYPRK